MHRFDIGSLQGKEKKMNTHRSQTNIRSHLSELLKRPKRKFLGLKEIPVEQIIGASTRRFNLFGRYLQSHSVVLHKVDGQYFVKNGHYRVSAARYHGNRFVRAKVWEYESPQKKTVTCEQGQCRKGSVKKEACAAG